jgi:hypothetical protein
MGLNFFVGGREWIMEGEAARSELCVSNHALIQRAWPWGRGSIRKRMNNFPATGARNFL